jgi:hypothetical protein
LTWKERRRRQHVTKEVHEPIYTPDVPGRAKLDLSAEYLEAMKSIPKVEHYNSKSYKGCQMKTKRVISVIEGNAVFKYENPDPNYNHRNFSMSIDDPNFGFVFLELVNENLSQEKLKK